ncbi:MULTISPECIES: hypothetical protein [Rossellomorea]|uniref:hypothetical protein n=1 Tax=Rossellomorea TaxID=2837508 RepID=UPI0011E93849|nr:MULTISPECIES: hypothetical protein [Rossellomorea]MDT9024489.1 hypothetical protein [Rossellomorea sp. YC4-1]TYS91763.1 hypothetical protein FZC88_06400 [Rossellomorea aquimaris]
MKEKFKSFGIPLVLIILFIGALFLHQLLQVKEQPQPDWSRSIPLNYTSEERPVIFNGDKALFLASNGKITGFTFEGALDSTSETTLDTSVTRGHPFWTDGTKVIQIKDDKLISSENNEVMTIAEEATGTSAAMNFVYFWNKENLFSLNPTDLSTKEVFSFSNEILDVYIGNSGSAVVQVKIDDGHSHLYYMDETFQVVKNPFAIVNTATNHHINGLTFTAENNQLTLLYNEEMRAQGTLSYKIFKLQTPMDEIGSSILKPTKIDFMNEMSGSKLQSPRTAQLLSINGEKSILFTSEGHRVGDENAISLYVAPFSDSNQLTAAPVSTTKHFTYSPLQLTNKNIAWLDYDGDTYELFGASQDAQVIADSIEWSKRSVKEAVNNSVLMIFSSLITIMVSFYWVLPSLFLLILLYIFKPNIFEKEEINWVEYASIIMFLVMPITFITKAMGDYFYFAAPEYLMFSGSEYIVLLVISAITSLLWKVGRDPDWGTFGGVFYFMGIYILLYATLIGPYIFNLF